MKRLYRSRKNRVIAGVCGGIGEYLDIDPVIIRIAWIVLSLFGGSGILAYVIAWIVIPDASSKKNLIEELSETKGKPKQEHIRDAQVIFGLFILFLGVMLLLRNLGFVLWFWPYGWAVFLILLGFILIMSGRGEDGKKSTKKQKKK
jgi:phage shock protein PspC (stress-responsive transcriptional regulator)